MPRDGCGRDKSASRPGPLRAVLYDLARPCECASSTADPDSAAVPPARRQASLSYELNVSSLWALSRRRPSEQLQGTQVDDVKAHGHLAAATAQAICLAPCALDVCHSLGPPAAKRLRCLSNGAPDRDSVRAPGCAAFAPLRQRTRIELQASMSVAWLRSGSTGRRGCRDSPRCPGHFEQAASASGLKYNAHGCN